MEKRIKEYVLDRVEEEYGKEFLEYYKYIKIIGRFKVFGIFVFKVLKGKEVN